MNDRENQKKEVERSYVERLLRWLPTEASIDCARESPDFQISQNGLTVGLEVERVFLQSKQFEGERWELTRRAMNNSRGLLPPLHVTLYFREDTKHAIRKRNRSENADLIIEAIRSHATEINRFRIEGSILPPFLDAISAYPSRSPIWQPCLAGIHITKAHGIIQSCCDAKSELFSCYRANLPNASQFWLLLVADWSGPSAFVDPSRESVSLPYESEFDRLFFLSSFADGVTELSTRQT